MIEKSKDKGSLASTLRQRSDSSPNNGEKSSSQESMSDIRKSRKNVFIETYGCQMNEYDTELVKAILAKRKYSFVPQEDEADIILLNTCAIREHAHRKVYGRVHSIHHKRQGNPVMIGILGCMATNLRTELFEDRGLKIDFIAGPDSYKKLPDLIDEASTNGKKAFDLTLSEFETYSDVYPMRAKGVNAWVAVMRGCNNFCTFCVVPYTRGRERSRSPENVKEEVERLAQEGFKQVTLLGQNVNSYKYENDDFASLLEKISEVEGIERIRFTSPHPKDFPRQLLQVIASNDKVCNQVHLPLQSGNNRILELMDRSYTREEFFDLAEEARQTIPNVVLSTDIIVGFPTETEADFQDTVTAMEKVQFDSAFIFKYSERKGTIAERKYPDDVSDEEKSKRTVKLNEVQTQISWVRNQAHIADVQDVLIEQTNTRQSNDHFFGRNEGNKAVIIPAGPYKIGQTIKVRITEATPHALKGTFVN